jgi:hypothetical protein
MAQWFIARGKAKDGPSTAAQLKELATQGRIKPNDMLHKDGMPKWVGASQLKGLLPAAQSAPPPLPVPPPPQVAPAAEVEGPPQVASAAEVEEIIAEVQATYQGGHPAFSQKATGVLSLGSRTLTFASVDYGDDDYGDDD